MAIVVPMRRKYKPRSIVESVVNNIMRLRSNCTVITHPNTPIQQHYKNRFTFMQKIHTELTPLLKRGFDPRLNERERWVGGYHIALGHNMVEATRYNSTTQRWECNFSQLTLCELKHRAPKRITVKRKGNLLKLNYEWKGEAQRAGILWAVYNTKRHVWTQGIEDISLMRKTVACSVPEAWSEEPLEVLVGFGRDAEGRGQLRGTHHFSFKQHEGTVTVRSANDQKTPSNTLSKERATVESHATPPVRIVTLTSWTPYSVRQDALSSLPPTDRGAGG